MNEDELGLVITYLEFYCWNLKDSVLPILQFANYYIF